MPWGQGRRQAAGGEAKPPAGTPRDTQHPVRTEYHFCDTKASRSGSTQYVTTSHSVELRIWLATTARLLGTGTDPAAKRDPSHGPHPTGVLVLKSSTLPLTSRHLPFPTAGRPAGPKSSTRTPKEGDLGGVWPTSASWRCPPCSLLGPAADEDLPRDVCSGSALGRAGVMLGRAVRCPRPRGGKGCAFRAG